MEYVLIFIAITFLIGTVSFAIPSKSSRKIATLRMDASKLGFKISSSSIGKNLFKNKDLNNMIYQIKNISNLKEAHFIRDKSDLILYSPLKLKYSDEYDDIKIRLKELSTSVEEIIFSKTQISFLWKEKIGLDELKEIFDVINSF